MLTLMTGGVFEVQYATLKHIALLTQVRVRLGVRVGLGLANPKPLP